MNYWIETEALFNAELSEADKLLDVEPGVEESPYCFDIRTMYAFNRADDPNNTTVRFKTDNVIVVKMKYAEILKHVKRTQV